MNDLTRLEYAIIRILEWADGPILGEDLTDRVNRRIFGEDYDLTLWSLMGKGHDQREVRDAIRSLRRKGEPILSQAGTGGGYWLARDLEEGKAFLEREFYGKALDMLTTMSIMKRGMEREFGGQLTFREHLDVMRELGNAQGG